MRTLVFALVLLVLIGAAGVLAAIELTNPVLPSGPVAQGHGTEQSFGEIAYGRYMTTVADCGACHTDPHGGAPFAGGRPIETPFGTVVSANITPDRETGIGAWTNDDFANALQKGFSRDGHNIYPAMPYPYYTKMSRRDVDAIWAYLGTLQPVHKAVTSDTLPFPLNIRLAMRAWNFLYFREGRFQPDRARDATYNRGAYLIEGPEHCGACHTPKSLLGGDKADERFQGGVIQGWTAPNITNDKRRGLGSWSTDQVVQYLKSGHNHQAASSGPMAEEVALSSSNMNDDDLKAMATYLKQLPAHDDAGSAVDSATSTMQAGAAIYRDSCSSCHGASGAGIAGLFPTLAGAPVVQQRDATSLIRVLLDGAKSVSTATAPTGAAMPSYGWRLDNDQAAAVVTYIRNSWGNQAPAVTGSDVAAMRKELRERPN